MPAKPFKQSVLTSAILLSLGPLQAATITVDNVCTIEDAIKASNTNTAVGNCPAGSGADIINIEIPGPIAQINLYNTHSSGPLFGRSALPHIADIGGSLTTINGNGVKLNIVTTSQDRNLISVQGNLTLRDTIITGSQPISYGAVHTLNGGLQIENCEFYNNFVGVTIFNSPYNNIITDSVFRNNGKTNPGPSQYAAGIYIVNSEATITNTSVINNRSDNPNKIVAGGVGIIGSDVTISNSTISGNSSICPGGLIISDSQTFGMTCSETLSDKHNGSNENNGINTQVNLINNTITNNSAEVDVGGILNLSTSGNITLQGNIIAGNYSQNTEDLNLYTVQNNQMYLDGHNIIGDRGNPGVQGVTLGASDFTFNDATQDNLFPLVISNGQWVHPLKPSSLAIDALPPACFGLNIDQEGKSRAIDGDGNGSVLCDIGALENAVTISADDASCTLVNAIESANTDSAVGGCQAGNGHDIITLAADSTHSLAAVNATRPGLGNFGLPAVVSGITLDGHGATIEVADAFPDPLGIAYIPFGGDLTIHNSHLTRATGVATVATFDGDVTLFNSNIIDNSSVGLWIKSIKKPAIINSNISGNSSDLSIGGGVVVNNSINFSMVGSTVSGNQADRGAGVFIRGSYDTSIKNSTISGNTAVVSSNFNGTAGGILIESAAVNMTGLTITGNVGASFAGGVVVQNSQPEFFSKLEQSIVSGNVLLPPTTKDSLNNPRGESVDEISVFDVNPFEVDGHNIFGQNGDAQTDGIVLGASDTVPIGATATVIETTLADNGGNTLTHLPVPGGAAIDAGGGVCASEVDQIGNVRVWDGDDDGNAICDVGAVEYDALGVNDLIFEDNFE